MEQANALLEVLRGFEEEFKQEKQEFKDKLHEEMTMEMKSVPASLKDSHMHRQVDIQMNMWSCKMMIKFKMAMNLVLLSFVNNDEDVNGYANDVVKMLMHNLVTDPEENLTNQLLDTEDDGPPNANLKVKLEEFDQDSTDAVQVMSSNDLQLQSSPEELVVRESNEVDVAGQGQISLSVKKHQLDASQPNKVQPIKSFTDGLDQLVVVGNRPPTSFESSKVEKKIEDGHLSDDLANIEENAQSIIQDSTEVVSSPVAHTDDPQSQSSTFSQSDDKAKIVKKKLSQPSPCDRKANKRELVASSKAVPPKIPANKPKKQAINQDKMSLDKMWKRYYSLGRSPCMLKDCRMSFNSTNISTIDDHIKNDHKSTGEWFCAMCPEHFSKYDRLTTHYLMLHLGHYKCACANCGFTSDVRARVADHYQEHDDTDEE